MTFKIGAYTYSAEQNITKVLFFTFGSQKVDFYTGKLIDWGMRCDVEAGLTQSCRKSDDGSQREGLQWNQRGDSPEVGKQRPGSRQRD